MIGWNVVKLKTSGIKAMVKQAHGKGAEHEKINQNNPFDQMFGR